MPFSFLRRCAGFAPRPAARLAGAMAALALVACGGNASRVEPYVPTSGVVFGDELSLVVDSTPSGNGNKYGVNYLDGNGNIACASYPMWSQAAITYKGLVFAECNPTNAPVTAFMRAAYGDRVANVAAKVTAYQASPGFTSKTLVTVMAGMWDILDNYNAVRDGNKTLAVALQDIAATGTQLGGVVNQIINNGNGGRVLYATVPSLGLSPCSVNPGTAAVPTCVQRADVLGRLSTEFNLALRLAVNNNGYYAGLVTADTVVAAMADLTNNAYWIANNTSPACLTTVALLDCTTNTLQSDAVVSGLFRYLWADELHIGPSAQGQIGVIAQTRVQNNPF